MERLMVSHEQAVQQTVTLIEYFLLQSAKGDQLPAPELLSQLSRSLESAQAARDHGMHADGPALSEELSLRYRNCLEQLRSRLAALETSLSDERSRLLREQSHLARAREWSALLSRTQ
jgi:hypothetical protein